MFAVQQESINCNSRNRNRQNASYWKCNNSFYPNSTDNFLIIRGAMCMVHLLRYLITWWRHQMETFSALLALCVGNSPVPGDFPAQRPVTRSFDVFFDLRLNKRLSKQSWGWWFETLSRPLWLHCNVVLNICTEQGHNLKCVSDGYPIL